MERVRTSPAGDRPEKRRDRGFTLVELLVVMTLIALIAALATPMSDRMVPDAELRVTAALLGDTLRRARGIALRENREEVVILDLATRTFGIGSHGARAGIPADVAIAMVTARQEQPATDVGRIRFFPDGTSTGGRVTLTGDTRTEVIEVDWFDGLVSSHGNPAR